jgi:hypothetical protein
MSTGIKRPYEVMLKLARELAAELSPACQRLEIAGSVRRKKAMCGDLELVCIADGDKLNNQLNGWLASGKIHHVEAGPKKTKRWGEKQKSFNIENGDGPVQVDVFIQTVDKFGYTLLVRTGNAGFSNRMVTPVGVRTHDGLPGMMPPRFKFKECLLYERGILCEVADETDIFWLFGMAYVEPELRTDDYTPKSAPVVMVAPVKPAVVIPVVTERPIYLPDQLPAYPGSDGTREGAARAAQLAIQNSLAMQKKGRLAQPVKRHISGIDDVQGDAALGPMFEVEVSQ